MFQTMIYLSILVILLWVLLSIVLWSIRNGISPMPTSPLAKKRLFEALPLKLEGTVYEMGSGWGTLAFPLAKKYRNCRVVGIESSPIPFHFSRFRHLFFHARNLEFIHEDFMKTSIKDASLIVCYLYPGVMQKLKVKFEKELKPGTWVISNTFAIPGWDPYKAYDIGDLYGTKIYIYQIYP